MHAINKNPIYVDYNNSDSDGAVRLHLPVTLQSLKELNLDLSEKQLIFMSDGEIEMFGTTTFRDGIWVAVPKKLLINKNVV